MACYSLTYNGQIVKTLVNSKDDGRGGEGVSGF